MRLLEKDPGDRYRRAAEVKAVLESLLDEKPVSTQNAPFFDATGRFIVYLRQSLPGTPPGGPPDTTIIEEIETGSQRELPRPHMHPGRWSPDGRSIVGWRHDGKVWICPTDGGACQVVTAGTFPVWSGDGRRVFVMRPVNDSNAGRHQLWTAAVK
jgi:hypothetical protein